MVRTSTTVSNLRSADSSPSPDLARAGEKLPDWWNDPFHFPEIQGSRGIGYQQSLRDKNHGKILGDELATVAGRWSFRERRLRLNPHSQGWFNFKNAHRLGKEIAKLVGNNIESGLKAVRSAAVRLTGWTQDSLKKLNDLVRRAGEKIEAGLDSLDYAIQDAELTWEKFRPFTKCDRHAKLLALLWNLCQQFPGWRPFGNDRLAKWLRVCRNTLGSDIRELEHAGLLAVKRDAKGRVIWNRKAGESREVIYTGPEIEPEHHEGEGDDRNSGRDCDAHGGDDPERGDEWLRGLDEQADDSVGCTVAAEVGLVGEDDWPDGDEPCLHDVPLAPWDSEDGSEEWPIGDDVPPLWDET